VGLLLSFRILRGTVRPAECTATIVVLLENFWGRKYFVYLCRRVLRLEALNLAFFGKRCTVGLMRLSVVRCFQDRLFSRTEAILTTPIWKRAPSQLAVSSTWAKVPKTPQHSVAGLRGIIQVETNVFLIIHCGVGLSAGQEPALSLPMIFATLGEYYLLFSFLLHFLSSSRPSAKALEYCFGPASLHYFSYSRAGRGVGAAMSRYLLWETLISRFYKPRGFVAWRRQTSVLVV